MHRHRWREVTDRSFWCYLLEMKEAPTTNSSTTRTAGAAAAWLNFHVIPQGDKVSFSERYGYKPSKEIIQIESMDEPLRNGLCVSS